MRGKHFENTVTGTFINRVGVAGSKIVHFQILLCLEHVGCEHVGCEHVDYGVIVWTMAVGLVLTCFTSNANKAEILSGKKASESVNHQHSCQTADQC
jgi:hypothetical protein